MRVIKYVFAYIYLYFSLWTTYETPTIDIVEEWIFSSKKYVSSVVYNDMAIFEVTIFSTITFVAFYYASGESTFEAIDNSNVAAGNFGTVMKQKYYWILFMPWIAKFARNWLENVTRLILLLCGQEIYETCNLESSIVMLLIIFAVQVLLASRVVRMAINSYRVMCQIDDHVKRVLDSRSM